MSAPSVTQRLMAGLGCATRLRAGLTLLLDSVGVATVTDAQLIPVTAWPTYARNNEQMWDVKPAFISVIKHHDRPSRRPPERSP